MKNWFILICAIAAFALGSTASAALLIYEPFDYAAGSKIIPGNVSINSGNGLIDTYGRFAPTTWLESGAVSAGAGVVPHQVANSGLTSPVGFPTAIGRAAALEGGATGRGDFGEMARMNLPGQPYGPNSVLYYSLLLQVSDLAGLTTLHSNVNANNDVIIAFNNSTGASATRPSLWADELVIRQGAAANTYNLGIRASSTVAGTTFFSGDYTTSDQLLVVTRFTEGATAGVGGLSELWINPNPVSYGAAIAPAPLGSTVGTYSATAGLDHTNSLIIGAGIAANANPNVILVDEIRVGKSWASVTAIPEASAWITMGLVGLCAAGAVRFGKRFGFKAFSL